MSVTTYCFCRGGSLLSLYLYLYLLQTGLGGLDRRRAAGTEAAASRFCGTIPRGRERERGERERERERERAPLFVSSAAAVCDARRAGNYRFELACLEGYFDNFGKQKLGLGRLAAALSTFYSIRKRLFF